MKINGFRPPPPPPRAPQGAPRPPPGAGPTHGPPGGPGGFRGGPGGPGGVGGPGGMHGGPRGPQGPGGPQGLQGFRDGFEQGPRGAQNDRRPVLNPQLTQSEVQTLQEGHAGLKQLVDDAMADGQVTKEEATAIRAAQQELRAKAKELLTNSDRLPPPGQASDASSVSE